MSTVYITLDGIRMRIEYERIPEWGDNWSEPRIPEHCEVSAVYIGSDTQNVIELLDDRLDEIADATMIAHRVEVSEAKAEAAYADWMERKAA